MGFIKTALTLGAARIGIEAVSDKVADLKEHSVKRTMEKTDGYVLRVEPSGSELRKKFVGFDYIDKYLIRDTSGELFYQVSIITSKHSRRCDIVKCDNPSRKIFITEAEKKFGKKKIYSMYDNTLLGEVICEVPFFGEWTKGIIKRLKKESVRDYWYGYKDWVVQESFMPHTLEIMDIVSANKMEKLASIKYKGEDILIKYFDERVEVHAVMAAFLPLLKKPQVSEYSKQIYYDAPVDI